MKYFEFFGQYSFTGLQTLRKSSVEKNLSTFSILKMSWIMTKPQIFVDFSYLT